jgi:hypothetical protein
MMTDGKLTYAAIESLLREMYEKERCEPSLVQIQTYQVLCPYCGYHLSMRPLWYADWLCMRCGYLFWRDGTIAFTPEQDIVDADGGRSDFLMDVRQAVIEGKGKQILVSDYS